MKLSAGADWQPGMGGALLAAVISRLKPLIP